MNSALSKPFLRLYLLALLFFSANAILNVILPLRGAALGASNGQIGLIMGTYMFTCMFFRPWAGRLIHKFGPEKILRSLLVVNGLALILYTVTGLEGYLAARVMQGVCTAFFSMALQIGIIDALPEQERSRGISLYSLFTYMPTIAGPILAIGLWNWGGMGAFTFAMIAIAAGTGWFGFHVKLQRASPPEDAVREGDGESKRSGKLGPLWICCLLMLFVSVVFGSVSTFIPLYAGQIPYGNAGVFLMVQASVIVIVRFAFSKKLPSDGRWHAGFVGTVCLICAGGAMLLSLSPMLGPTALYGAAMLIGLAQATLYPTLISYLTFVLPKASRNVLIGWFIAMADLGVSLGGAGMGPVADAYSYRAMYSVSAALAVVCAVVAWANRKANSEAGAVASV
ncbi:staphylopine family metallophore export MFS transporter CntE [Cohnella cellulosilytica]|uniref:Staphylopine family metallophore export MFS transporter CntE n=1 Tax=Cohnella cellulosilytica TaxID=986710 RepID=A0ABW2FM18_9BACL